MHNEETVLIRPSLFDRIGNVQGHGLTWVGALAQKGPLKGHAVTTSGDSVSSFAQSSLRRRGVVSLPGANVELRGIWAGDPDVDLAPGPVGFFVGRDVVDRVLRADLAEHLVVDAAELFAGAGAGGRPSARFRN